MYFNNITGEYNLTDVLINLRNDEKFNKKIEFLSKIK